MRETPRRRPQGTSPGHPQRLLGIYPVPELHLVGTPIPRNPRSPLRWQPTPPPLQYGIDYTFTHRAGREPARWPDDHSITVRLTGTERQDRHSALAIVVGELRALIKLDLVIGDPTAASLVPSAAPAREIRVGYLPARELAGLSGRRDDQAGFGAAACSADCGCCYVSGVAVVNADLAGPDATAGRALAILRHELAHALGLGHAARPSLLMHHQIAPGTIRYGRGDQHGLMLLGPRPPADPSASASHPHQDDGPRCTDNRFSAPSPRAATPPPRISLRLLAQCFASPEM